VKVKQASRKLVIPINEVTVGVDGVEIGVRCSDGGPISTYALNWGIHPAATRHSREAIAHKRDGSERKDRIKRKPLFQIAFPIAVTTRQHQTTTTRPATQVFIFRSLGVWSEIVRHASLPGVSAILVATVIGKEPVSNGQIG
jgi:hypothetical protein